MIFRNSSLRKFLERKVLSHELSAAEIILRQKCKSDYNKVLSVN